MFEQIPQNSILTPHLREWDRLFGEEKNDKVRIEKTISICIKHKINILIKGHFSCLISSDGEIVFNGTGNAGMAKAGSGDVLTGLITGLLAQGYMPRHAALIGMYLHGLAGDLAKENLGEDSMLASDQINYFSNAFLKLRTDILNHP
jgi:NAD(P)H-hydrate epimerase